MNKNTLVVNLFGGPGSGKSTMMAALFARLKNAGVVCEMAHEWVKSVVWEAGPAFTDQIYIFGKQQRAVRRLIGQVDVIVTDAPLVLSSIYGRGESAAFHALVWETFRRFNNFNVFLTRMKPWSPAGRWQSEEQARALDDEMRKALACNAEPCLEVPGLPRSEQYLFEQIRDRL